MKNLFVLFTTLILSSHVMAQCLTSGLLAQTSPIELYKPSGEPYQDCYHVVEIFKHLPTSVYLVKYKNITQNRYFNYSSPTNAVTTDIIPGNKYDAWYGYKCKTSGDTIWEGSFSFWGDDCKQTTVTCDEKIDGSLYKIAVTTSSSAQIIVPPYAAKSSVIIYYGRPGQVQKTLAVPPGQSSIVLSGLSNGSLYLYQMQVKCANNLYGDLSAPGMFRTK